MTLENLLRTGQLKAHAADERERDGQERHPRAGIAR
jgi:hypothetical protein